MNIIKLTWAYEKKTTRFDIISQAITGIGS